ncbi:secretion protein HlyD [Methylocaldum marinum]|uniref:Secretion protein HlyD n=1 Tax=Methylocaldum marinum TaxID=1432792 RepID=A0A250KR16_9GAMM|nr:efflux RND transporter periplasmic adaptor subunit [Methylocaldum marinum]BBA33984.1 secretion protein HlyD [Methylocaldum marinum]
MSRSTARKTASALAARFRQRTTLVVLAVLALVGYWLWPRIAGVRGSAEPPEIPPVTVTAAHAEAEVWRTELDTIGNLVAVHGVQVTTEVAGMAETIGFESGAEVEQGAPLVRFNTDIDRARLERLEAEAEQARRDLVRIRELGQRRFASESEREQAATRVETLEAQVREQRVLIGKKRIEAPFAGILGLRYINLGQYLEPGQAVVDLQSIVPIYTDFTLPSRHYGVIGPGLPVRVRVDAYPDQVFEGEISAVSPQIDRGTHNFSVRATLPNSDRLLRPGMFADVIVTLPDEHRVVTVPNTAISYSPYGDVAFLIREENPAGEAAPAPPSDNRVEPAVSSSETRDARVYRVERVFVTTGERRGLKVEIRKGIAPGDRVVTSGQLKLGDGARVLISDREVLPDIDPIPEEP